MNKRRYILYILIFFIINCAVNNKKVVIDRKYKDINFFTYAGNFQYIDNEDTYSGEISIKYNKNEEKIFFDIGNNGLLPIRYFQGIITPDSFKIANFLEKKMMFIDGNNKYIYYLSELVFNKNKIINDKLITTTLGNNKKEIKLNSNNKRYNFEINYIGNDEYFRIEKIKISNIDKNNKKQGINIEFDYFDFKIEDDNNLNLLNYDDFDILRIKFLEDRIIK